MLDEQKEDGKVDGGGGGQVNVNGLGRSPVRHSATNKLLSSISCLTLENLADNDKLCGAEFLDSIDVVDRDTLSVLDIIT